MSGCEVKLDTNKHILLHYGVTDILGEKYLENFYGRSYSTIEEFNAASKKTNTLVYICGDIETIFREGKFTYDDKIIIIIELSNIPDNIDNYRLYIKYVHIGQVPINVHNVGVMFPKFFVDDKNYFNEIEKGHNFQSLTESDKPGSAFRKGLYLTEVLETSCNQTFFNLLRCSTNLNGPTVGFRKTDKDIIRDVNFMAKKIFDTVNLPVANLNHVLAQIYYNSTSSEGKEKKAKIKEHSDKTKDMPRNGIIAFCSFYKEFDADVTVSNADMFDYCYKKTSVLTRLRFRLKDQVQDESLVKKFDITLYPNSVFLIPLLTNRLYTHEIIPSGLPVSKLPTRLGYVIRCSNTYALHKDGQTYILRNGKYIKLEEPTEEGIQKLKEKYFKENTTIEIVKYDDIYFSLNRGDYTKPIA